MSAILRLRTLSARLRSSPLTGAEFQALVQGAGTAREIERALPLVRLEWAAGVHQWLARHGELWSPALVRQVLSYKRSEGVVRRFQAMGENPFLRGESAEVALLWPIEPLPVVIGKTPRSQRLVPEGHLPFHLWKSGVTSGIVSFLSRGEGSLTHPLLVWLRKEWGEHLLDPYLRQALLSYPGQDLEWVRGASRVDLLGIAEDFLGYLFRHGEEGDQSEALRRLLGEYPEKVTDHLLRLPPERRAALPPELWTLLLGAESPELRLTAIRSLRSRGESLPRERG